MSLPFPGRGEVSAALQRERLERAGTLHWFHWAVVMLSLSLTVAALWYAQAQVDSKVEARFARESTRVVKLIEERMVKYEDALWGGVGVLVANGRKPGPDQWRRFSETLSLEHKYPGINGIGVIDRVPRDEVSGYLAEQRRARAEFRIHPAHDLEELMPIVYIEPVADNFKAVGLDMAHETNRRTAAYAARDTGTAQITGPIVLVQDSERTPGFLFFTPYYGGQTPATLAERRREFRGLVYAPFIVNKLMRGTLARSTRDVGVRISDGDEVLYDELEGAEHARSDRQEPLFTSSTVLNLYGRKWRFDIETDEAFRAGAQDSQPLSILIGGIIIDALLLTLFIYLSRANRRALDYAKLATEELRVKADALAVSNGDLERFAHAAAHDLQEPLRMVGSYVQLIQLRYQDQLGDNANRYIQFATEGVARMQALLIDLLGYARLGQDGIEPTFVDMNEVLREVQADMTLALEESGATVRVAELHPARGDAVKLRQLFQNLLANAAKFRGESPPEIHVSSTRVGEEVEYIVSDNGIGIAEAHLQTVFAIFQRLHTRRDYTGNGVGLAICKRVVDHHGGRIWATSTVGAGSTFHVRLPAAETTEHAPSNEGEEAPSAANVDAATRQAG